MNRKKIIVASHERSGTHFLINTIACNFGYSAQQVDMDGTQKINWRNPEAVQTWLGSYRSETASRIFKSHHDYRFLAPLYPEILDDFHVFYIYRDGRDVMTSFWIYLNRLAPGWGPRAATIGEFMCSVAAGGVTQYHYDNNDITMLRRWVGHVNGWKNMGHGVHFITYEELHTRFEQTLGRIASVLGEPASHVVRPTLDAQSSLPWKGVIGAWRMFFTDADVEYFNAHAGAANP